MSGEAGESAGSRQGGARRLPQVRHGVRRVATAIPPATAARILAGVVRGVRLERPVFIVGVPRSATSSVFGALRASPELSAMPEEEHVIWNLLHHPRRHGWRSGAVGPGEVRRGERRLVAAYFRARAGPGRVLDKTPANSLRIPHLIELFEDATVVVVRRNPPDVVNALIKAWRDETRHYASYLLPVDPQIPGNPTPGKWRLSLPPGWRDLIGAPVPIVALRQWAEIAAAIERARPRVDPGQWLDLYLEELLADPAGELERLCAGLGVSPDPIRPAIDEVLAKPIGASTAPGIGKWRRENRDEVEPLLARIAELAPERGYLVDAVTGESEPLHPSGS